MNPARSSLLIASFVLLITLGACNDGESEMLNGYVESENVLVAATSPGLLAILNVRRGDLIKAGDPLFSLDLATLKADLAAADATRLRARADLTDLTKGKRSEELDVIFKQKDEAAAVLNHAQQQLDRSKELIKSNAISQSQLDSDTSTYNEASARVAGLEAQLKVDDLGAREDQIAAAKATVELAEQQYIVAQKRLTDAAPIALTDARVEDTYFNQGEYVPAGKPVVSLLPAENVKIRFFVPESRLSQFQAGTPLLISCDGCPSPVPAKVSFVASSAEYTPPVIYSVGSRDKLVFLIEAKPDKPSPLLHTGLPIDVRRASSP